MTVRSRTYLKAKFETGDTPTETDFGDAYDSEININDDIDNGTDKPTPIDADKLSLWDSVSSSLKTLYWSNLKAIVFPDDGVTVAKLAPKFKGSSVISAVEIDWDLAQVRTKTITGNTTFTFTNLYIGVKVLEVTGSFTVAFPAGFVTIDNGVSYDGTITNYIEIACNDTGTPTGTITFYKAV